MLQLGCTAQNFHLGERNLCWDREMKGFLENDPNRSTSLDCSLQLPQILLFGLPF